MPKATVSSGSSNAWADNEPGARVPEETPDQGAAPEAVVPAPEQPAPPPADETVPAPEPDLSHAEVRAWAKENGIDVADAGPVPAAVIEQYTAATAHPADEAQDIVASGGLTLKKPGVSGA